LAMPPHMMITLKLF